MATAADLQDELKELIVSLNALERARYLSIASMCCLLYDYMLTFDDEVRYFWDSSWSISRALFFFVCCSRRYWILQLTRTDTAIIVLRICYVYSKNLLVRGLVVGTFVTCSAITLSFLGIIWHELDPVAVNIPGVTINSCSVPQSQEIWKLYVPNLVLHTILYLATTLPVLRLRALGKQSQLMDRLARDGGVFYFVVFASALFSTLGALSSDPLINVPAIYSDLLLVMSSVAISRLMLGIHSLAARLSVTPDWLLNNTELGRVNWKPGLRAGELIVEIEAVEEDELELNSVEGDGLPYDRACTPVTVHTTRVGVLDHPDYPGTRDYKAPPRMPKKRKPSHSAESERPVF
ncbi:hypothetical protein OH76DRAFT_1455377 [Lentinus brumalis]|uniref:DUF6533 domain-containing protein n=1 Tax=Lentinus brumalis TaxID=2498619 RepID=A0A371DD90_9APHY|nr:hypothetical protein OH76DRAFT_1455377 [Polyporus brumalis]